MSPTRKHPPSTKPAHEDAAETVRCAVGRRVDVEHLYAVLTHRGWKFDTEESDLFGMLARTFWDAAVKVIVVLENHCCVPPNQETEVLEALRWTRFDPAQVRRGCMKDVLLADVSDEDRARVLEDHGELLRHGDPEFEYFELLQPVAQDEVDARVRAAALADLVAAVRTVD